MAALSGKAIERIKDALLAAFDRAELIQLVRIGLNENLEVIVTAGKLEVVAYDLVLWAQRHERLGDLLVAAQAERPKNARFAALAAELDGGAVGAAAQAQAGTQPSGLPGGVSIGEISNSNVSFGGTQMITQINTEGGAYVGGNVDTRGGDFIGKDKTTTRSGASVGSNELFFELMASVALNAPPPAVSEAMGLVTSMQVEAARAGGDERMAQLVRALVRLAPKTASAVVAAFGDLALYEGIGPITRAALTEMDPS